MINFNKIYCIGIGGIGVSALARLFFAQGKKVSGSDLRKSQITDSLEKIGINVIIGQKNENVVAAQPDLVIYSEDVSENSPGFAELQAAKELDATIWTQAEAVGFLMAGKYGVGVTGTNGKSTTTAMLGLILEKAELDPTVLLGTMLLPKNETAEFKANARFGQGKYFVAESDEYRRKMLKNHPQMIVVTNIAEDHLDYYNNLEDIKNAFLEYVKFLPPDGIVIYNADDHNTVEVCRHALCHKLTFGINHYADLQAINLKTVNGRQSFDLHLNDEKIGLPDTLSLSRRAGEFELSVPGHFNVSNALGAGLAAMKLGAPIETIKQSLAGFAGTWRRFEVVGSVNGKPVISDYAHHPAGVAATIQAAAEFYPGKKILVVFQPHHRNRTLKLCKEFIEALMGADEVILPEIFEVAGREHGERVSSQHLVEELRKAGETASFAADLAETEKMIKAKISEFDVILMMGAGDIDTLARRMVD